MFKNKKISFLVSFVPEAASLVCFIHYIEVISPFFLGWDTDPSEKAGKSDKHKSKAQLRSETGLNFRTAKNEPETN